MNKMHQGPANDNLGSAQDALGAFASWVRTALEREAPFRAFEQTALKLANELVRLLLEQELQAYSDRLGRDVWVDGVQFRRHTHGRATYHTLGGPIEVARWTYRRIGERNGPTLIPLELHAGMVEHATPECAYAIVHGFARSPIRHVEAELRVAHRVPPSRAKMDRLARWVGTDLRAHVRRLEEKVRATERVPVAACAANLSLDRTTVPMEEIEVSEQTPKRRVRYRMAYVATLTLTDAEASPLVTRRYAAPAHEGPHGILARLMADLRGALAQRPDLCVGVVQDNAPEMWNLMREALAAEPSMRRRRYRQTVDFYHLMEHLARMLDVMVDDDHIRTTILRRWRESLLRSDRAIYRIRRWLDGRLYSMTGRRGLEAWRVAGCYLTCSPHFRYASLPALGLHRGSGVVEGACKTVIAQRAKRSGQRWTRRGASAVLAVRSLLESERLADVWTLYAKRFTAHCEAA